MMQVIMTANQFFAALCRIAYDWRTWSAELEQFIRFILKIVLARCFTISIGAKNSVLYRKEKQKSIPTNKSEWTEKLVTRRILIQYLFIFGCFFLVFFLSRFSQFIRLAHKQWIIVWCVRCFCFVFYITSNWKIPNIYRTHLVNMNMSNDKLYGILCVCNISSITFDRLWWQSRTLPTLAHTSISHTECTFERNNEAEQKRNDRKAEGDRKREQENKACDNIYFLFR